MDDDIVLGAQEATKRYQAAVCRNFERIFFQHGSPRFLPDSDEDVKWQQQRDELCAKAHEEAAKELALQRDRIPLWQLPPKEDR